MRVTNNTNQPVQSGDVSGSRKTDKAQESTSAKKAEKAAAAGAATEGSAKTDISAKAREFAKAKEVAGSAPDVREEKIAELKRRIQSGAYSVDPNAISDRMVNDHLKTGGA
jgi:negative regulator of flagellin synthesis FlgM